MSFDQMMIHFASPTVCGIKPANLFSVKEEQFSWLDFAKWRSEFAKHGIIARTVKSSGGVNLVLVYNVCWQRKILADDFVCDYLKSKGYCECSDVSKTISRLICRIKTENGFPHEIGIVLGYPVLDVAAFEKHEGQNCKYCGCWESYTDVEHARKCTCRYKNCSHVCKKWFDEGYSLSQIVEKYKNTVEAA